MVYVTEERNRAATIAAVGALHAGVIYALIVGLAGPMGQVFEDPPLVGEQIPLPKLPPDPADKPNPQAEQKLPQSDHRQAESLIDRPTNPADHTSDFALPTGGSEGSGGEILPPLPPLPPTPPETFTPRLARPVGRPGLWVTPNDYPTSALRAEQEGTTRFRLGIGTDGKVQTCEIVLSSGFPTLDTATCANLRKRGRFTPATDASGAVVPGTYSAAVKWTIPKD